jgi:uncharacterized protein (TIGR00288 family)
MNMKGQDMETEMKIAVLIDAENIASKYTGVILNEANNLGDIIIKRIYGDWTARQMSSWKDVVLDNCIQPIQQYSNVSGKNSSDSALIIDAMDLLYQSKIDAFCIVSSDSDFTRLASRLRESEKYVLGLGEQKTPQSFISACSKFSYIDLLYAASREQPPEQPKPVSGTTGRKTRETQVPAESKGGSDIQVVKQMLVELCEENSEDDGWILSSKLAELLNRKLPDFDVRNFRFKKFTRFVESLQVFEAKRQAPDGQQVHTIYFRVRETH